MAGFMDRVRQSWDVFVYGSEYDPGPNNSVSSDAWDSYLRAYRDSSSQVIAPIVNRIAIDAAAIPINHIDVDENDAFLGVRKFSELNQRLNHSANIDQTGAAAIQDAVTTMLEQGVVALVPIKVTKSPRKSEAYDILDYRVGVVKEWFTKTVLLSVYNEKTGVREDLELPKTFVAIAQNPFYMTMNEANSTTKRLIDKLALMDISDNKAHSPNLDLILQLPYSVRNEKRLEEAEKSLRLLENQLKNSRYGVAYVPATEKVTQLNRPVNNVMLEQIQWMTESLHSQLGMTPNIFSGSASPEENVAYHNRTVLPILKALTDAMARAFLTKTAMTQGQTIRAIPSIFKFEALANIAEAADKLTRNELATSNEIRSWIGLPRSSDPEADKLRNKNLNKSPEEEAPTPPDSEPEDEEVE